MRSTRFLHSCWYKWAVNETREQYNISRLWECHHCWFFPFISYHILPLLVSLWHFVILSKCKRQYGVCTNFLKWYPRTGSIFVRFHLSELEWDDIQGSISFEMDLKQNSVNSLKSLCIWQRKTTSIECQCRKGTEFYEDICKVDFPVEDENARCGDRFLLWPTFWRNEHTHIKRALLHFQNSIRPINFPSISISYELGVCLFVTI